MTLATAGDSVTTIETIALGEFATVVGRLTPVDEADCTNSETRFDSMEPVAVIGRVDLTKPVDPLD